MADSTEPFVDHGHRFTIHDRLDDGASSEVFRAYDTDLQREVALKRLSTLTSDNIAALLKEFEKTKRLRHDNIINTYDLVPLSDNACAIVMEYLPGDSLKKLLQRESLSVALGFSLVRQIATGLDYAHRRGVMHLDLKPSNIYVTTTNTVKLIDFGLARSMSSAQATDINPGTPQYMAPEQLAGGDVDARTDVYSLGLIAYELLTGQWPFATRSFRRQGEDYTAFRDLSQSTNDVLMRSLAWERDDRWISAGEFTFFLRHAIFPDGGDKHLTLEHLTGVCHQCDGELVYRPHKDRFHCTKRLTLDRHILGEARKASDLYCTVFPESTPIWGAFAPPHPQTGPIVDVFAVSAPIEGRVYDPKSLPALPYPTITPRFPTHLRCGNAVIRNLGEQSKSFGFASDRISVCDMSTYYWSNTLKDPRSWAVIHTALASSIRHLGIWTAGNAGLSLAKMVHTVNQFLSEDQRLHVHCYNIDPLSAPIRAQLMAFGANVAEFGKRYADKGGQKIIPPELALDLLNQNRPRLAIIPAHQYWDVSDGWDGVGLYMYRLLARQICSHLRPATIMLPLGTGDLFYGFYLGRNDCIREGVMSASDSRLVAVAPFGNNVLKNYDYAGLANLSSPLLDENDVPVAPKLMTVYTPLLLAMHAALTDGSAVDVIEVRRDLQEEARTILQSPNRPIGIAAEPSALMAFAGLLELHRRSTGTRVSHLDRDIMVINSGCGVLGEQEYQFMLD